jgi:hypothetical protein
MAVVYRHIRLDNGLPFYIGISKNLRRPYSKHLRTEHWNSVVNKCGYEVEILFDNLTYELAKEKEKEFIKLYGRSDNKTGILVNKTDGGDGAIGNIQSKESKEKKRQKLIGRKFTEETLKKLSEGQIGFKNHQYNKKGILSKIFGIKRSQETKNKLSEIAKNRVGEKNPMFGRKHNEETKQKIRERALGRKVSEETKKKIINKLNGKPKSEETKRRMSEFQRSDKNVHRGKKLTEETKMKISQSLKLKYMLKCN